MESESSHWRIMGEPTTTDLRLSEAGTGMILGDLPKNGVGAGEEFEEKGQLVKLLLSKVYQPFLTKEQDQSSIAQ